MESDFVRALLSPPQPVIIGVRMKPLALGHIARLHQIESAFVKGEFPGFEELISAALICAHTWEENQKLARSPFRRWLTLRTWGLFAGKFDIPNATLAMVQHVRFGDVYPETEPPDKPECVRELYGSPIARIYLFLRASGFSESEAWNMPANAANWLHAVHAEEDGRISMLSPRRRAFLDIVRRENAAAAQEVAA